MNRVGKRIETIYYSVNKYGTNRVDALLNEVEKNIIMERFKSDIKHNNQEYKALIEEYRNGIMIFDLSEKNIWNKAAEDSLGLITYYNTHKSDFSYPATHLQRTISTSNKANAQNIYKVLLKYPNIATTSINDKLKLLNEKELVTENTLPYTGNEPFNISTLKPQKIENKYVITQKYQFQPKKEKAFEECRGYVVAAYQQQLEEEWIANLKKKYPVIIHQNVLQKMIKQ